MKKNRIYLACSICSIALVLFIWWLATEGLGYFKSTTLAGPITTFTTLIQKFYDPRPDGNLMQVHIWSSLKITLMGFACGVVVGNILGTIMGWYEKIDLFVRPIFDLIKPVPGIAWIPVVITLLGIGVLPKVVVIGLAAMIPSVVNSYTGIRQTKDVHIWVAEVFGAGKFETLLKVAIPSAIPYYMTGMKVALGNSWATIVGAEMLASTCGLGYLITLCRGIYRTDVIIAGMICIGVVGALLNFILGRIEKQLMKGGRW
ncbi:MAG: ABC transporter permease [Eubacteriales bacterium]